MIKCEWCGEKTNGGIEIAIIGLVKNGKSPARFMVCGTCLNLYGNNEFDKLEKRVRIETNKDKK